MGRPLCRSLHPVPLRVRAPLLPGLRHIFSKIGTFACAVTAGMRGFGFPRPAFFFPPPFFHEAADQCSRGCITPRRGRVRGTSVRASRARADSTVESLNTAEKVRASRLDPHHALDVGISPAGPLRPSLLAVCSSTRAAASLPERLTPLLQPAPCAPRCASDPRNRRSCRRSHS